MKAKKQKCVVSHALNTIQHTLISTLSSITLDEVNQTIVTKYRLNDLNQWVLTNSKNTVIQAFWMSNFRQPEGYFYNYFDKIKVFLTNILVKMTKIM